MSPFLRSGRRRIELPGAAPSRKALRSDAPALLGSLRFAWGGASRETRAATCPSTFENADVAALHAARRGADGAELAALPTYKQTAAEARGEVTISVLRDSLKAWLASDDGRDWAVARKTLFQGGTDSESSASSSSS